MLVALLLAGCGPRIHPAEELLRTLHPQGYVTDKANVLSPAQRSDLEQELAELEQTTSAEIAVVILPTIFGADINDFATRLFENWQIGKKGQDNGLLFIVALKDHQARIEVGYGLEAAITDARAGRILDTYVLPEFRQGDYATGIIAGTRTLASLVREHYGLEPLSGGSGTPPASASPFVKVVLNVIFFLVAILLIIRHPFLALFLFGGGSGGGGFGGGFGGFGGGASGGGGASRGW